MVWVLRFRLPVKVKPPKVGAGGSGNVLNSIDGVAGVGSAVSDLEVGGINGYSSFVG